MLVEDLRADFEAHRVGVQTQRKALMMLQGILRRAVVPGESVSVVDKPRQPPTRRPDPLAPITVERIRSQLTQRDAALVSLLAYAGLRPDEATKARWGDLRERTMHVYASKTERARTIKLLQPLAQDLAEWRTASGRPTGSALIFPTHDGDEWQLHDRQNWRRRIYQPAAKRAGVTGDLQVYRLRASFVSLLLREGHSLTYVAEQAGHSVATLAKHYAGTLDELKDTPRTPAAEAINAARRQLKCAQSVRTHPTEANGEPAESPATTGVGDAGLEPATSALSRRRSPS
jgi:integrase